MTEQLLAAVWTEKHRPKEFADVVGIDPAIAGLMPNPPHLLFVGPPGTGKTTTARIIIDKLRASALELNASDERGINTIREKVKNFAMNMSADGRLRIVFLDEADALTFDAQNSLRNLMERYAQTCRFILTGNYENKINDAIKSRCSTFHFRQPNKDDVAAHVMRVANEEGMALSPEQVRALVDNYYPDVRSMVGRLQELHAQYGEEQVPDDALQPHGQLMAKLAERLGAGKFGEARQLVLDHAAESEELLDALYTHYVASPEHPASVRRAALYAVADATRWIGMVHNKGIIIDEVLLKLAEALRQ